MTYVDVADRRTSARRCVPLVASVRPVSGGPPIPTHSVDLSMHGVLLACVGLSGEVLVDLAIPGHGRVRLPGVVVRHEPGRTAVRFGAMSPGERSALAGVVLH